MTKYKKFFLSIVSLLIFVSVFAGCSLEKSDTEPVLIKNFECDMKVTSRGKNYICHLKRSDNSSVLTVEYPSEISGLELEYQGGVYSVMFKGLKMSLDDSKTQLTQHFFGGVMNVLDKTFSLEDISKREVNGVWIFEGSTTYGDFEIDFDEEGKLLALSIPKIQTDITFENFVETE